MAGGKLAFVQYGNNRDDLASECIEDGVVLDTEAAKARLQVVNRKPELGVSSQGFEAFPQTAHVEFRLSGTELLAGIGPDA